MGHHPCEVTNTEEKMEESERGMTWAMTPKIEAIVFDTLGAWYADALVEVRNRGLSSQSDSCLDACSTIAEQPHNSSTMLKCSIATICIGVYCFIVMIRIGLH